MRSYARNPTRKKTSYQSLLQHYCKKRYFLVKLRELFKNFMDILNYTNSTYPLYTLIFENKFIFYKRKEGNTWENENRDEKGMGVAESIISEYEKYYRPNNLEVEGDSPDEIIHGVRDRMMQGPLGTRNILSGGNILERRVHEQLQRTAKNAPRIYRQMLDEEIRNGASKKEIAQNLFTYDIENGGSYTNLLTTLRADIMGLGFIGSATFVDSQNPPQQINLANPAQTNVFERATGAPGHPGNVAVTIRWHQEDLTSIRKKLEQVGLWGDFSRQDNAREFIHIKFRQSLIERTVWKEKTKLSKNKYDPQRLKNWLEDDIHQKALADTEYQTWYGKWSSDRAGARGIGVDDFQNLSVADLSIDERNELAQSQREARERIYNNSLEAKLKKILIPGEIESVTKSLETRTMLSYLFYKMQDKEDRGNIERLIDEMAGINYDENMETLEFVSEKISEFSEQIRTKTNLRNEKEARSLQLGSTIGINGSPSTGLYLKIDNLRDEIDNSTTGFKHLRKITIDRLTGTHPPKSKEFKNLNAQISALTERIDEIENKIESIEDKINELQKEKTTVDSESNTTDNELAKILKSFTDFMGEQKNNSNLWGNSMREVGALYASLSAIDTSKKDWMTKLQAEVEEVVTGAKNRIAYFERQEKIHPKFEKTDSRGLLYKLVKRDIERKGNTADPLLEEESLITTNILLAQARNQEIYGNVNQSIATRIEQGGWTNADEWLTSKLFFSPIMTGAEAIEHACDTDNDLNKLSGLNMYSTPSDMIRIMQQTQMISSVKLRELQKKLGELLRGVILGKKKIRIVDKDAPRVEKFINNLVLVEARLSAEERLKEIEEGFYDTSKPREHQIFKMLQNQTSDSIEADERIAEDLESHDAQFKRFFLKKELKEEYKKAMDELEGLPKEDIEEELRRRGLTARVRARGVLSLRATRFLKKAGMKILKYNPVSLAGYGLFKGGSWFYGYAKSIIWTDNAKIRAKAVREGYRGAIIEPVATVAAGWPLAIGSYVISRPKTWLRKISDWGASKVK